MRVFWVVLCYLDTLVNIVNIKIQVIRLLPNIKSYPFPYNFDYSKIEWNRKLAEVSTYTDDKIKNTSGSNIKEVERQYNRGEIKIPEGVVGHGYESVRELFSELVDELIVWNYDKELKREKQLYKITYDVLKTFEYNVKVYNNDLLQNMNAVLRPLYKSIVYNDMSLLRIMCGDNMDLNINTDGQLMVNGKTVSNYLTNISFETNIEYIGDDIKSSINKQITLNIGKLLNLSSELIKLQRYIKLLHFIVVRIPLVYYRSANHFLLMFQINAMIILEERLNTVLNLNYLENLNLGKNYYTVNVDTVNFLLNDMLRITKSTIDTEVHRSFVKMNKVLNGDLKCLLAIFLYILNEAKSENTKSIQSLEEETEDDINNHPILSNLHKILLDEKNNIKLLKEKFEMFVQNVFNFDINEPSVRNLQQKLYEFRKGEIMSILYIIVHQLITKRQITKYKEFVDDLQKKGQKYRPLYRRIIDRFVVPQSSGILTFHTDEYDLLLRDFLHIREEGNIHFNLLGGNRTLRTMSKLCLFEINKLKIINKLYIEFMEAIYILHEASVEDPNEKIMSKKKIVFYLYLLNKFNNRWV
ncbi:fam-f protein [Plasmodium reichenowi]|uniref:Fam-f protein n=1 Tax=Plasmodium reichenowi TaxID=5854 RepID=A0A2P9DM93_PLARE|nr:fam-f protein [Plasmodium reichenowi]